MMTTLPPLPTLKTGADLFLKTLMDCGVETIFGYPGGVVLSVYQSLKQFPLKHVLVRHEQGATHMAEGYAKASGKPGVVLVTSGPGATNTITGIADAYYDSVPLVVFTGNVSSDLLGNDAFQEADIIGMTRACTKHSISVRHVSDLKASIEEAFHVATTGRPGPVLVDMPKDILTASLTHVAVDATSTQASVQQGGTLPGYTVENRFTLDQLEEVVVALKEARQPVLLMGGGVITSQACEPVLGLAEQLNLPVASSLMGLGGIPSDHPNYMGFCGMHGHYWANMAIAKADLLLVVGNRLNERQTGKASRFASNATIVHIDLDPTTLDKCVKTALAIQGEIPVVLAALKDRVDQQDWSAVLETRPHWFEQINQWKATRTKSFESVPNYLAPEWVIDRLYHWLPEDAIITTEVGQHQMWAAQRHRLHQPRSFITSGGLGTMGFGFPAAIGAQVAYPDRLVMDIAGDGSFQMTLQELAVAVDYGLPVKVAIINNGYLGMVRQWQDRFFEGESQSRFSSPDYVKLAEAYGAKGFCITHPEDVDSVIQQAYAITDGPVLMDFRVQEKSDVFPWVPAGGQNDQMFTAPSEAQR